MKALETPDPYYTYQGKLKSGTESNLRKTSILQTKKFDKNSCLSSFVSDTQLPYLENVLFCFATVSPRYVLFLSSMLKLCTLLFHLNLS